LVVRARQRGHGEGDIQQKNIPKKARQAASAWVVRKQHAMQSRALPKSAGAAVAGHARITEERQSAW